MMQSFKTTGRSDWYSIYGFRNSCWTTITPEVLKEANLTCDLTVETLKKYRGHSKIAHNVDLVESFSEACRGEDKRWKLLEITLAKGELRLTFLDTKEQGLFGAARTEIIFLPEFSGAISATTKVGGVTTDYRIFILDRAREPAIDGSPEWLIGFIQYKDRNEDWPQLDLITRKNGEFFVKRHINKEFLEDEILDGLEETSRVSER